MIQKVHLIAVIVGSAINLAYQRIVLVRIWVKIVPEQVMHVRVVVSADEVLVSFIRVQNLFEFVVIVSYVTRLNASDHERFDRRATEIFEERSGHVQKLDRFLVVEFNDQYDGMQWTHVLEFGFHCFVGIVKDRIFVSKAWTIGNLDLVRLFYLNILGHTAYTSATSEIVAS